MSQDEVYDALERKGIATAEELMELVEVSWRSIERALRCLLKEDEVELIKMTKEDVERLGKKFSGRHYAYKVKRRTRK